MQPIRPTMVSLKMELQVQLMLQRVTRFQHFQRKTASLQKRRNQEILLRSPTRLRPWLKIPRKERRGKLSQVKQVNEEESVQNFVHLAAGTDVQTFQH